MIDLPTIVEWLQQNPQWVLIGIAFVAFIESLAIAGIVVPGVAILFAIAVVAGGADISLTLALLAGVIGAVCGDTLSFFIGHHYQDRLRSVWPFSRFPDALASGTVFFEKHGGKSVVIGRFIGPIRPVLPVIAGMLGMSPFRFIAINILSALAWSPAYILPGYLVGAAVNVSPPQHWLPLLSALTAALVLGGTLFSVASRQLQRGESWYNFLHSKGLLGAHSSQDKPLASLVLLVISAAFFSIWSIAVTTHNLAMLDQLWLEFALSIEFKELRTFFVAATLLGDERFLVFSFVLCTIVLIVLRQWRSAITVAAAGLMTSFITHSLKSWFAISRPDVLVQQLDSMAYPSGHSSGSIVLFGIIATLCAERSLAQNRWRLYLAFIFPALVIGFSRVVLVAHWFSDVIGGILLGLIICSAARIADNTARRLPQNSIAPLTAKQRTLALFGAFIWLIGAVVYMFAYMSSSLARYALSI